MTSSFEVRFTEDAERDIRDILQDSLEQWGAAQRTEYREALDRAFEQLSRFPFSGTKMNDRYPNRRKRIVKKHIVIYRVERSVVTILRVVHERSNYLSLLTDL